MREKNVQYFQGNQLKGKDYQIISSFACWKAYSHFSTSSALMKARKLLNTTTDNMDPCNQLVAPQKPYSITLYKLHLQWKIT